LTTLSRRAGSCLAVLSLTARGSIRLAVGG
jgi:hypothetical protein